MRNLVAAFLFLTAVSVDAQWTRPAREIRTETNTWTFIPTTKTNAQLVFNWLDAQLYGTDLDGSSWTNLPATNVLQTLFTWIDTNWDNTSYLASTNKFVPGTNIVGATFASNNWTLPAAGVPVVTTNFAVLTNSSTTVQGALEEIDDNLAEVAGRTFSVRMNTVLNSTGFGEGGWQSNGVPLVFETVSIDTNLISYTGSGSDTYFNGVSPKSANQVWHFEVAVNYTIGSPAGTPVSLVLERVPKSGGASSSWLDSRSVPLGGAGRLSISYIVGVSSSYNYQAYLQLPAGSNAVIDGSGFYIANMVPTIEE